MLIRNQFLRWITSTGTPKFAWHSTLIIKIVIISQYLQSINIAKLSQQKHNLCTTEPGHGTLLMHKQRLPVYRFAFLLSVFPLDGKERFCWFWFCLGLSLPPPHPCIVIPTIFVCPWPITISMSIPLIWSNLTPLLPFALTNVLERPSCFTGLCYGLTIR